jgi:hypothetical protein
MLAAPRHVADRAHQSGTSEGQELVEVRGPGQPEAVEDVGHPVPREGLWRVADVQVEVRRTRRARVSHSAQHLPGADPLARPHAHAAGVQVTLQRIPPIAELEYDAVAAVGVRREGLDRRLERG